MLESLAVIRAASFPQFSFSCALLDYNTV
uniref:Uncharacterized protein n=1 Tax=Moniliophthora roreri TaxID=221103 RepID=A0A0W0GDQ7_MONRR